MVQSGIRRVVIVEDEGLIAEDIRQQLIAAGYDVPGIADASREALRLIGSTSPDLVLMDIRIKGDEDGISVAGKVRDQFDVPVVFLTAYEDVQTLERASRMNPYGYLRKPLSGASLRGSIEIAISKHRYDRQVREQRDWAMSRFAAVPYGVIVTDKAGRVTWMNSRALELTGQTIEGSVNQPYSRILRLMDAENGEPVPDIATEAMIAGQTVPIPRGSVVARPHEDAPTPLQGSAAPILSEGGMDGVTIAFDDATEARFDEEQRRLATKHSALRRLVDGVAPHLPTLGVVDAVWDTVLLADALNAPPKLRESVDKVHRAVMESFQVGRRISELLETPEVMLERTDLNDLVRELEQTPQTRGPQFDIVTGSNPVWAQVDGDKLVAALKTFIQHARRRMSKGARLRIAVTRSRIGSGHDWARIRLTYPSSEPAQTVIESAFEPRWKPDAQDPYMAYELVRKMGGKLMAHCEKQKTIMLDIYLPQTFPNIE